MLDSPSRNGPVKAYNLGILLRVSAKESRSVSDGDRRVAVSSGIQMVRIRPDFMDRGEWGWTAGSATSQLSILLSSIISTLPKLFVPLGGLADFDGLGFTF